MMKILNRISKISALGGMLSLVMFLAIPSGSVKALSCIQYNPNGFVTSATPLFNDICNVPVIGNEPNFVRIRQDTAADDTNNTTNPDFNLSENAACTPGEAFDVETYIHNNASADDNDNGAGTAPTKGETLTTSAPLGVSSNSFTFSSTVSADNAATVNDATTLTCANDVTLSLVKTSVNAYGTAYNWTNLPSSDVNSKFAIGSPVIGSGIQWGCWNYRIYVVYQVVVNTPTPTTTPTPTPSTPTPTPTPIPTTTTTPPTQLVNTGPGDVVGIFAATAVVGAVGHRLFRNRFAKHSR